MTTAASPVRLRGLIADDLPQLYGWYQDRSLVDSLVGGFRFRSDAEALRHMEAWLQSSAQELRLAVVRTSDEQRNERLQAELEDGRATVGQQVLGAIVLAALLAIAFGVWITTRWSMRFSPIARIARSMQRRDESTGFHAPGETGSWPAISRARSMRPVSR